MVRSRAAHRNRGRGRWGSIATPTALRFTARVTRRELRAAAILLGVALLLSACAPKDEGGSASATSAGADACAKDKLQLVSSGKLTVGTDKPAYEPWFKGDDPSNGQGFESAVAYAVAGKLGFSDKEVAWAVAPFNSVIQPGPKKFDFDINQVSITDERKRAVDFSSGYYVVSQAVVALKDSRIAGATKLTDLKGAKLGAAVGTTSYRAIVDQIKPGKQPAVFDTNDVAKAALKNGQIDGLVLDLPTAFYVTAAEIDTAKIVGQLPPTGPNPEEFGLVLEKGSPLTPCASKAVDALRGNGDLKKLQDRWLSASVGAPVLS
jgi:polar amino acid transport system substrate-binding protein